MNVKTVCYTIFNFVYDFIPLLFKGKKPLSYHHFFIYGMPVYTHILDIVDSNILVNNKIVLLGMNVQQLKSVVVFS